MPIPPDHLGAVGIGVADLAHSAEFYIRVLGLKQTATFKLATMDEIILSDAVGNAVALMHWTDGSARNYRDNPVKLVFHVADPVGVIERIRAEGLAIPMEPAPYAAAQNRIIGMGTDPDGYVVEVIEARDVATL